MLASRRQAVDKQYSTKAEPSANSYALVIVDYYYKEIETVTDDCWLCILWLVLKHAPMLSIYYALMIDMFSIGLLYVLISCAMGALNVNNLACLFLS
jgi:hypothetical protein